MCILTFGPGYGRSFTLKDPSCNTPNGICQFTGGANAGPCSNAVGILDLQEIQDIIKQNNLKAVHDQNAGVKCKYYCILYTNRMWLANKHRDHLGQ